MAESCCNKACIVQGEKYRFSVLTPFMMRMEYSETGVFEDLQTQTVLNREFPVPEYTVTQSDDRLEIETEAFHMIYDKKKFSEEGLFIDVKYDFTNYGGRWYFGAKTYSFPPREHNLKGTMRTLDRADGKLNLNTGLWIRVEGRFLMTANRLCLMKKICHQKGNMKRLMFIILHMGVIILRVCVIFINYRGLFLFFQDTLLETGGAGIGNTVKKATWSC